MKKALFLSIMALLATAAVAQPKNHVREDGHHINRVENLVAKTSQHYKLASFRTDDNYQFNDFYYDGQHRLIAVKDSVRNEYSVIDSVSYNDQNQLVRLDGWQLLNGAWKHVYYVEYTYDNQGNIASRTNYNNFGGEWNLGGIYTYEYNDAHQIVLSTLTMMNIVYQTIDYTYADGLLQEQVWSSYDGYGLTPSERSNFYYEDGRLIREEDSTSDNGRDWVFFGLRNYEYDSYGNCVLYSYVDYTGGETDRNEYSYNYDLPLADILMPWTPEQERPKTYNNVHACTVESWYTVDVDHRLQYVCDYLYNYTDINAAITEVRTLDLAISPNPAHGLVTIQGAEQFAGSNARLEVIDEQGRIIFVSRTVSQFDASNYAPGCYVVRVIANGQLHTTKLMVK